MRKLILTLFVCLFAPFLWAQKTEQGLNATYSFTLGDYAALILPELLRANTSFDAPIIVTYEPESRTIDVGIFGVHSRVEQARESIKACWGYVTTAHLPYMKRRFNVDLAAQDFRIYYYDRTSNNKKILSWVNGQFIVPE